MMALLVLFVFDNASKLHLVNTFGADDAYTRHVIVSVLHTRTAKEDTFLSVLKIDKIAPNGPKSGHST